MASRVLGLFALGCILLTSVVGCGVGDYEKKMVQYQDRVARFEEMNRLLGDPLVMPRNDDKQVKSPLVNLFLRPPRGIASAVQNENDPRVRIMYTYGAKSQGAAAPFVYVEIGFAKSSDKDFESNVMGCFTANSKPIRRKREIKPLDRGPLSFSTVEFEGGNGAYYYSLNFYKGPTNQAVVAYWLKPSAKATAAKVIELSLQTFGLDGDAMVARNAQVSPLAVPGHPK